MDVDMVFAVQSIIGMKMKIYRYIHVMLLSHALLHTNLVGCSDGFTLLKLRSGVPQGSGFACISFNTYYKQGTTSIAHMAKRTSPELAAPSPVDQKEVQCALTTFVDDIAPRTADTDHSIIPAKLDHNDDYVERVMDKWAMKQNLAKSESLANLFGVEPKAAIQKMFTDGTHSLRRSARYLGRHLMWNSSASCEVQQRITSTTSARWSYARFWRTRCDMAFKSLIFKCVIQGTLLSGLNFMFLAPTQIAKLERTQMRFARLAMVGAATKKDLSEDANQVHTSLTNAEIRRRFKFGTVEAHLRIQKMRWLP